MTFGKDWNEAFANGHRPLEAADFIWANNKRREDAAVGPDMSILRRNQLPAPRFPLEVLGPAADWVRTTAESKCAPVDYVGLGVIVTTAGIIGPKRRVSPWEGWDEPSILWGANVGP